ncbi:hypothetical protein QTQ03_05530 [Micromonospora sp. WMMA1363]|uniref:hypothetical protein n=1 Tax=Micromonospora sp. WMMA1363 TaxID=3053985 RepID=UPI00259CABB3|nr:hypothetical protein [Micromonospora sp. WMMA1363]MDM4719082.1 hypothetical protein [Micromonospora sp. WMMA1363]
MRAVSVLLAAIGLVFRLTATGDAGSGGEPPPTPSPGGDAVGMPFGPRTLTGTVERAGDCTMLLVGERRWALTGEAAAALRPGTRVTIRGNLAPRPAACGDRDLAQTVAVTRVDPGDEEIPRRT